MRALKAPLVVVLTPPTRRWPFWRFYRKILLPAILLAVWTAAARSASSTSYLLPSPGEVARALGELAWSGALWVHLAASLIRVVIGFSLAAGLALPLGLWVGLSRCARELLSPVLRFLQHVPPIAWIPLFILWLGIGEASKNAVIAYAAFFPIFLNTLHGIASTDPRLVEVGLLYRLTPQELVREIYLPAAAPALFTGFRLGLGYSWRALVAAELIAAPSGLGYLIVEARELSQPPVILAGVVVIGLVGLALEAVLAWAERRVCRLPALSAREAPAKPSLAAKGGAPCHTWK